MALISRFDSTREQHLKHLFQQQTVASYEANLTHFLKIRNNSFGITGRRLQTHMQADRGTL